MEIKKIMARAGDGTPLAWIGRMYEFDVYGFQAEDYGPLKIVLVYGITPQQALEPGKIDLHALQQRDACVGLMGAATGVWGQISASDIPPEWHLDFENRLSWEDVADKVLTSHHDLWEELAQK